MTTTTPKQTMDTTAIAQIADELISIEMVLRSESLAKQPGPTPLTIRLARARRKLQEATELVKEAQ